MRPSPLGPEIAETFENASQMVQMIHSAEEMCDKVTFTYAADAAPGARIEAMMSAEKRA